MRSPLTTETGIGTSCATSSTRRAVTTTPSVSCDGVKRHVERGGLTSFEHQAAHAGLEPVERRLEAVRAGHQPLGTIGSLLVGNHFDGRATLLGDDSNGRARDGGARRVADEPGERARLGESHTRHQSNNQRHRDPEPLARHHYSPAGRHTGASTPHASRARTTIHGRMSTNEQPADGTDARECVGLAGVRRSHSPAGRRLDTGTPTRGAVPATTAGRRHAVRTTQSPDHQFSGRKMRSGRDRGLLLIKCDRFFIFNNNISSLCHS